MNSKLTDSLTDGLILRINEGDDHLPHLWILETTSGMWIAEFPKLTKEARPYQEHIIKNMVKIYNENIKIDTPHQA